jgi:hypothetical protein
MQSSNILPHIASSHVATLPSTFCQWSTPTRNHPTFFPPHHMPNFDSSFLRLLHLIYYFSLPSFIPSLLTFFTSCSYLPPALQLHFILFYTILYHHYTLPLLCSPSPFLPSFLPYLPHSLTFLTYNLPDTITCSPHWHTLFHTCPGRAWSLITT